MRFLPQLNSISSALCTFFKHLKRITIYFYKLTVFLSSSPARGAIYRRKLPYVLRKDLHSYTE